MSMYTYFIPLILSLAAVRSEVDCDAPKTNTSCDREARSCSQKSIRFDGDNEFFNCSVGHKEEIVNFKKTNSLRKDVATLFDAPDLLGVSSYWIRELNSLAIEITFRLPRAIHSGVIDQDKSKQDGRLYSGNKEQVTYGGHYQHPNAIFLKFSSVWEEAYRDRFYYKCPRERIFIFHNYSPPTHYDVDHPRNISYRCMFGLDRYNPKYTYILSLNTSDGRSRDFYITLPVRYMDSKNWRPAVATNLNVSQRTIEVIVEPQPRNFTSLGYDVTLCTKERGCGPTNQISLWDTNRTVFKDISHGVYFVKVVSRTCAAAYNCSEVISYTVDATKIEKNADSPLRYLADLQPTQIVTMVVGCVVGVMLVLVLTVVTSRSCLRRRRKREKYGLRVFDHDQKPQGIVIHPFLDVSRSNISTDRKYVKVLEDFQNFIGKECKCKLAPIPVDCLNGDTTALDRLFGGLKFVIVVCTDNNSNRYFRTLLTRAIHKKTKENNLFVIPVTFSCFPSPFKEKCIEESMIELLQNMNDLLSKIHCIDSEEDEFSRLKQSYENTPEYKDLESSIKDASPVPYFENINTKTESEQGTKPNCEKERNSKPFVGINQPNSTKCERNGFQHKPCMQDIGENSPEIKQQEIARIKTKLSRFNDSSSDISYNGARPKESCRDVHVAREKGRYVPDEISGNQFHQCDQTPYQSSLNSDRGGQSYQMSAPHRHILNENERLHIKTYSVPYTSGIHEHRIRSQPTDYDNESTLLARGQGSNIESNAPYVIYETSANFSPSFEYQGMNEKVPISHTHDWSSRQNDITMQNIACAIPRAEHMQFDCKYNTFNHHSTPVCYGHLNQNLQTRLSSNYSRDPYYGEQNIHPLSSMSQNLSKTSDVRPNKDTTSSAATAAVAKTSIYFPALDKFTTFDVTKTSIESGKLRTKPKALSIPSDLNTISDWIPPETGSILVTSNDDLMDKMSKINENYTEELQELKG
ncbi:uncharacterized protein LOC127831727 isoform X1 [Dreissena polymorpha]|uniref:SEFIR domain-containing protein n=1 Tax=Dreissena polymorpha TaxID=45954 RepID=A0A9D4GSS7_DREPO|nr:uncharacterized protein LOC127831727 isoform X1 [Dreissena polymorpha]KAH3820829.1 hypothetical protein DPMN_122578 [Dreissena polymorpha]